MTQEFRTSRKVTRERALAAFREISAGEDEDLADAKAPRTLIQYSSAWRVYVAWCEAENRPPMPAAPTAQFREYIRHLSKAGRAPSTIDAYLGALATIARYHGCPIDRQLLAEPLKAARRRGGPPRRAKPLRAAILREVIESLDSDSPRDARDATLLLLAFGAALRSAEVAGLDWARTGGTARGGTGIVTLAPAGIVVTLTSSKTAQLTPIEIPVPDKDLSALRPWINRWVRLAKIGNGEPLFRPVSRHGHIGAARLASEAVTRIIRARLERHFRGKGMPELEARAMAVGYSSHSPRRGYVTTASEAGQSLARIRRRSRHSSDATLGKYIAAAEDWTDSGLEGLWPSK